MVDDITLPCAEIEGDYATVRGVGEGLGPAADPIVCLDVHDHMVNRTNTIAFNKDTARQLFNWLGVWLHTQ